MNDDRPVFLPWLIVTALRQLRLPDHDSIVAGRIVVAGTRTLRWEPDGADGPLGTYERAIVVRARRDGPARPTKAEMDWATAGNLETFGLWVSNHRKLRLFRIGEHGLVFLPTKCQDPPVEKRPLLPEDRGSTRGDNVRQRKLGGRGVLGASHAKPRGRRR